MNASPGNVLYDETRTQSSLSGEDACQRKIHVGRSKKEGGFFCFIFEEQKESYWIIVNRGEKVEGKVISWAGAHHVVP